MPDPIPRLNAALEGRYRIERQLGEGGMATVYLARDEKHNRNVALKVLKPELAAVVGAERFLAEIKTTANLQHPHILPLFDSGEADSFLFYVMPYVEGESLRERLDREHQLPVDEAVQIATKVAGALQAAHEQGVIHRDIKPANILLSKGEPLVSDFGIALALGAAGGGRLTETGLSLGTPHYMSPEQATGDASVGTATDVYALGCVLYEMLVGEPPYTGSTPQAILGKIITGDVPAATDQRASVPPNVDAAIRKALGKVPADRFASARRFVEASNDPAFRYLPGGTVAAHRGSASGPTRWIAMAGWVTAGILAVLVAISYADLGAPDRSAGSVARGSVTTITLPPGIQPGGTAGMDRSPDGRTLVFVGFDGRESRLFRRELGSLEVLPIPGAEEPWWPFFSPDGASLAFFRASDDALISMRSDGSGARTLGRVPLALRSGGWTNSGEVFVSYTALGGGIGRAGRAGDEPERVAEQAGWLPWIDVLPEGNGVLSSREISGELHVVVASLPSGEVIPLVPGFSPRYAPSGHLLYLRGDVLWAAPFDAEALEITGDASLVAEGVQSVNANGAFAVTEDVLVYQPGGAGGSSYGIPVWVDRAGNREPLGIAPGRYTWPRVSPDGDRVALVSIEGGSSDIVIFDVGSGNTTRLTFDDAVDEAPVWTPDGERVVFASDRDGERNLYWRRADGSDEVERLTSADAPQVPYSVTRDSILIFEQGGVDSGRDLWALKLGDDGPPTPILQAAPDETQAAPAPSGGLIAFQSDELGYPEIYVRGLGQPAGPWMISTADVGGGTGQTVADPREGTSPVWSPAGDEIFYKAGRALISVPIDTDGGFTPGTPEPLFDAVWISDGVGPQYDVAPDGERFLIIEMGSAGASVAENQFVVIQDWVATLDSDAAG